MKGVSPFNVSALSDIDVPTDKKEVEITIQLIQAPGCSNKTWDVCDVGKDLSPHVTIGVESSLIVRPRTGAKGISSTGVDIALSVGRSLCH